MSFGADSTEVTCLKMCYFLIFIKYHPLIGVQRGLAMFFSVSLFLCLAIGIGNGTRDERKGKERKS